MSGFKRISTDTPATFSPATVLLRGVFLGVLFGASSLNAATNNPGSWTRGAAGSVYAEWDVFDSTSDTTPDIGSSNIASAQVTETSGAGYVTGSGNIYNNSNAGTPIPTVFTLAVTPDSNGPVNGESVTVYLQLVTLAFGDAPDTASVLLDGVAADSVKLVSADGTKNTYRFAWTSTAQASLSFSFAASDSHMSLAQLAVDIGNVVDVDGDGIFDTVDNCLSVSNSLQEDADGDLEGDACDATPNGPDTDGDGVADSEDNCASISNADQKDYDADGQGNTCDTTPYLMKTIQSSGAQDGWLLESTETSKKGGKLDAKATTLIVGDSATDQEYRSVLHFDTANLPDTAVIVKAILTVKKQSLVGSVIPLGNLLADMRVNYFGSSTSLANSDFEATAGKTSVATLKASGSTYSALLNTAGKAYIGKKGTTQFRLRFSKDDNDDKGNDYLKLYSGNAPSSSRPSLVIEYYVP